MLKMIGKQCLLLLAAIIIYYPAYASNLIVFQPNNPILASDVNNNFSYIKSILQGRNVPVNFKSFQIGDVISVSDFETEFEKMRTLNMSVNPLTTTYIKSSELNQAFAQIAIDAALVDDVPLASNFNFSVNEDTSYSGLALFNNQTGTPVLEVVSPPIKGSVVVGLNGNFTYSPFLNQNGSDSFTFRVSDGNSNSNVATASININPINDPPVANPQSGLTLLETDSLNINLTASDIEGSNLTYEIVTPPAKATLSGSGNLLTYTPNFNQSGTDSFTFRVSDGELYSNIATISLNITPVWPIGTEPALNITTGNQTIAAGTVKNYSSITIAAGATLTIQGSNAITVLGSSGPVVINGSIIVSPTATNGIAPTITTPDSTQTLSFSPVRSAGGNGAAGGRTSPRLSGAGGTSVQGRGGGGGGGSNDPGNSTTTSAAPGSSVANDSTTGNGNNGGNANNDAGGSGGLGAQNGGRGASTAGRGGGGGGGGGYFGAHGLSLFIKTKQGISGTGSINLSGKIGFNGGRGGNGDGQGSCGGGGGGGGAGGSGGNLWIVSPSIASTVSLISDGGLGGSPGLGGGAGGGTCSTPAQAGQAGSPGSPGIITTLPYP